MSSLEVAQEEQEDISRQYLTFYLGGQPYGVPISDVVRIIGLRPIAPMPNYPEYAKGIISMRDEVVPVIDLNLRFGKPQTEYGGRACIVVVEHQAAKAGILVDLVEEVARFHSGEIEQLPLLARGGKNGYIAAMGRREAKMVLLLDTNHVIGLRTTKTMLKTSILN